MPWLCSVCKKQLAEMGDHVDPCPAGHVGEPNYVSTVPEPAPPDPLTLLRTEVAWYRDTLLNLIGYLQGTGTPEMIRAKVNEVWAQLKLRKIS